MSSHQAVNSGTKRIIPLSSCMQFYTSHHTIPKEKAYAWNATLFSKLLLVSALKKGHIFNLIHSTPIGLLLNLSPLAPSIAVNGQNFLQTSHIINTFCCSRSFQHPPELDPNTIWRQNISLKWNKSNSLCGVKPQKMIIIWTRCAINP
jgi:hypothetical protein